MKTMTMAAMVVAAALATGGVAAAKSGALDGKSFSTLVGEKGKPGDAELLTFKDGKFRSKVCDAYGFGDGSYTTTTSGGATTFEADTASVKEGKMHWRGTINGDRVSGTYVWTKTGQAPVEGWFKSK